MYHYRKAVFPIVLYILTNNLWAQESFDLILLETQNRPWGFSVVPGSAKNVTNRAGYDNQPHFINNLQLVFTSKSKSGSSDIIMYNFESDKFTNMSRTDEKNEFSPSLTSCGQYISAVTVEEDSSQRLWLYPINMGEPELLYDDIQPVGYYGWYEETAALFVLDNTNKLLFPYSKEDIHHIADHPGRCIQQRPKTKEITFLDKGNNIVVDGKPAFELKAYHVEERTVKSLGLALSESEDFCWLDKNRLLMAKGKDLYMRNVRNSIHWEKIASVSLPGYGDISRLALSPKKDKLVLVMERLTP
ncbi:hypothetical protein [Negadavirga shengliensis]|uniref:WD40 repeat protein n=1 Tax=Negadavirga shengliensis TaxID=1389218 RepID=A0ABV9T872_9BACT